MLKAFRLSDTGELWAAPSMGAAIKTAMDVKGRPMCAVFDPEEAREVDLHEIDIPVVEADKDNRMGTVLDALELLQEPCLLCLTRERN